MTSIPAIEINSLTKRFKSNTAVDDLNLTIERGTVYGFIGPNGAGKTTTIRLLMNLLKPDAGQIHILGMDNASNCVPLRRRIGFVPEFHYFHRWMRVKEVIWFCRSLYATWNDALCDELLELFELNRDGRIRDLSKGMLAKLALLLAVAHEPELLILDEPTSGLDPLIREEFLDALLQTLCRDGQTILFSSHILSDVRRLADRIGIIFNGKLLANTSADDLVTSCKRVSVTVSNDTPLNKLPFGTVYHTVKHRQWVFTIYGSIENAVDELRGIYPVEHLEVHDLGLEDIFKDFIKGAKG